MSSVVDDRGFNQGFKLTPGNKVRMERRCGWFIEAMGEKTASCDVLEIGCGRGEVSFWMAQKTSHKVLGSDLCEPFIEQAKQQYQHPNLNYLVLDFNSPDILNGQKFDFIFGNGILHHLYYNLDNSLAALKSLLKENGKIIFMEPNIYNPYCAAIFNIKWLRKITKLEPDEMAFSKSFITKKLQTQNFNNIKVSYRDFLLPGLPMFLVKPSIWIGNVLEKIPLINKLSQSIFIEASF